MQEILKADAALLTATIRRSAVQLEVLKAFYKSHFSQGASPIYFLKVFQISYLQLKNSQICGRHWPRVSLQHQRSQGQ